MKLVLLALLATFASVLTAQTTLNIDIDNDFSGFAYLDKVPDSARVFLAGENHAYRNFNNEIKEKTLRYLHAHRDVRLWISEMGAGRAYLINQGLIHGDSTMFDVMSDFSWEEDVNQYRRLAAFNDTLPEDQHVQIYGVDVEHGWVSLVIALDHILTRPNQEAHDSIRLDLEAIHGLAREIKVSYQGRGSAPPGYPYLSSWRTDDVVISNLRHFRDHLSRHRSKVNAFVGDDRTDFDLVFDCLDRTLQYHDYEQQALVYANVYRELHLAEEVAALLQAHPGQNAFGQFGRCHVSQADTDSSCTRGVIASLAARLENEPEYGLEGHVVSTAYLYPDYNWDLIENPVYNHVLEVANAHDPEAVVMITQEEVPDSLISQSEAIYDHYIINHGGLGEEKTPETYYDGTREAGERGMGGLFVSWQYNDFSNAQAIMADYFGSYGLSWDESHRDYVGISIGGYGMLDGYNMVHLLWSTGNGNQIDNDTLEVRWSSGKFLYEAGYDMAWLTSHFNFTPKGVVGYMGNSFQVDESEEVNAFLSPTGVAQTRYELRNNAFLAGAGLNLEYEGDHLVVGLQGTYLWDLSRTVWRSRDIVEVQSRAVDVDGAPRVKFHHWTVGVHLGWVW